MHLLLFKNIDIYVSFSSHKMSFKEMLKYNITLRYIYTIKHASYTHFVRNR